VTWLWVIPPAVAVAGLAVAAVLTREMAAATRSLRREVELSDALRPAVTDLHAELRRLPTRTLSR
jgi:hypothetical protein